MPHPPSISAELARELFRILVRGERVMYFLPSPEGEANALQVRGAEGRGDSAR